MKKSPYDIIRGFVEKIIIPKYPFLKLETIDSFVLTNYREYDIRFEVKKKLDPKVQTEIDSDIKDLFRMASLDEKERWLKNRIKTWFKTPKEKEWNFHSEPNYEH